MISEWVEDVKVPSKDKKTIETKQQKKTVSQAV
jgi:hypothetical protein